MGQVAPRVAMGRAAPALLPRERPGGGGVPRGCCGGEECRLPASGPGGPGTAPGGGVPAIAEVLAVLQRAQVAHVVGADGAGLEVAAWDPRNSRRGSGWKTGSTSVPRSASALGSPPLPSPSVPSPSRGRGGKWESTARGVAGGGEELAETRSD